MAALGLLLLLFAGTVLAEDPSCRDIKKQGIKVDCPTWVSCKENCEWWEMQSCDGLCGGGMKKETRSRTCKYFDEGKNRNLECLDSQDKLGKCKMDCGKNGKYNELLDFCECNENWGGVCCNEQVTACANPMVVQGETDRSTSHRAGTKCDNRLRPGWYRFESPAGNLMPNECVPYGSCNTGVPFWLNGTHPRPADGIVDRVACGTQADKCCAHKVNIKVRNCVKFMAYYLQPMRQCVTRFCVGTHEKCPDGEMSDTGFQPGCSNDFPDVKVTPTVGYHVKEEENNKVYLTCSAAHAQAAQYLWKAQWFFDDEPGPIQVQKADDKIAQPKFSLPTDQWKSKMGTQARCTLQAKRRNGQGTWSIDTTSSREYYLGITVVEDVINVKEGETAHVTLRPNLPVRCDQHAEALGQCDLGIAISLDPTAQGPRCPGKIKEISQVIFHGDMESRCGFRDINHANWHTAAKLQIKPKVDIQLDKNQQRTLRMRVHEKDTRIPEIWHGYVLPSVIINIIDADDRGSCTLINDPHITTFDKRQYDFHDKPDQRGDKKIFVVYKHTKEDEEVQARFFRCSGRVYCICGVAVRSGASTVVFDKCRTNPSLHPELNYAVKNPAKENSLRVFKHNSGTVYHVFMPTGAQLKVHNAGGQYMWIEIKSSVEGKGRSVGLCGDYNGNAADDLRDAAGNVVCQGATRFGWCQDPVFWNSWVVEEGKSIFAGNVPPHRPDEDTNELYCDCVSEAGHHGYEDCDYHKKYEPCDDGYELFTPAKGYSQDEFSWLVNYQAPRVQNPAFESAVQAQESQYYSGWSYNTWTEENSKEFCEKFLNDSPAVTACLSEIPEQDYSGSIMACALDLVLTGSTEFAAAHLEDIKSKCSQELRMNLDLWEPREGDTDEEGKAVLVVGPPLRLTENLCPNECSGNGACDDGKCICKKGFTSYDCSLSVNEVPLVKGIVSSEVPCDRSKYDCYTIGLEGMKFIEGKDLTCHYYNDGDNSARFFYSDPAPSPVVTTNPATLFSLWVVQCSVPEQLSKPSSPKTTFYKMQLAVSNDGQQQSDRAYYGSYDGSCETCENKTCTRKADTCIIASRCYANREQNPANNGQLCDTSSNAHEWSEDDGIICNGGPQDVVIHRDPKDCTSYFVCIGTDKKHYPCPIGNAFDPKTNRCVDRNQVPGC